MIITNTIQARRVQNRRCNKQRRHHRSARLASTITLLAFLGLPTAPTHAQNCPPREESGRLTASDGGATDFGITIALNENYILSNSRDGAGDAVYVFDANTGAELKRLTYSGDDVSGSFGISLAIDGNLALIGDSRANFPAGAAYLFDITTGEQLLTFRAWDYPDHSWFGSPVALQGDRAVIGSEGAAYVFDVTTGEPLRKLTAPNGTDNGFGRAISLDDDYAIIGATAGAALNGEAYIVDINTGENLFTLTASDGEPYDYFGTSVAISGDRAIVGALRADNGNGAAYVYDVTTGVELFKLTLLNGPESAGLGYDLALDGDLAVISGFSFWGSWQPVYLFDITTGQELASFNPAETISSDFFGDAVAIEGDTIIVGALGADFYAGAVYLFDARSQLSVTPTPLRSRQAVEFTACGLKPNKKTWLLYTYKGLDPHLVKRLNITVDLLNPRKLRKRRSDAAGNVTWQLRAPRAKTPKNIWFQVAQKGRVSNYIATQIIP